MTGTKVIQFRVGALLPDLEKRVSQGSQAYSVHLVADRDLARYYYALKQELAGVVALLSQEEISLILDSCSGTLFESHTVPLLWANIADSIRLDGLDWKWNVEGSALVKKLQGLSYAGGLALVDAVERFWIEPNPMDEALARAGLTKGEDNGSPE